MNAPIRSFQIPIGSLSLTIPANRTVPGLMWESLAFAALLDREGYDAIARQEVERIQRWLIPRERRPNPPSQWYAVRTATRRERAAEASLREQGFTVFLPMETRWGRAKWGPRDPIYSPLIPGYLFILTEPGRFGQIQDIDGVHQFVGYFDDEGASRAFPIPLAAILEIQTDERTGAYDRTRQEKRVYRPVKGDQVKVTQGPWLGFIGKVLSTPKKDRVHVMVQGPHGRGVTLDAGYLLPA